MIFLMYIILGSSIGFGGQGETVQIGEKILELTTDTASLLPSTHPYTSLSFLERSATNLGLKGKKEFSQ